MNDALKTDGVNVIAVLVIAAFAIDRIVTGLLFVAGFFGPRAKAISDAAFATNPDAARTQKLVYFLLACMLCAVVLIELPGFRVLSGLGYQADRALDTLVTALIVLAGSDRMSDLLGKLPNVPAQEARSEAKPIEVTGKLILEEPGRGA